MVAICLGVILAAFPNLVTAGNISVLGVAAAVVSGIAFAFYLIFMQLGFQKLHPVPVSLIQFSTIFVLSSISLMAPLPAALSAQVSPENRPGIIVGGIILGILTLIGYLFNNFGVRFMGAARASIIASSGPVMTALLAFLIIPGKGTALQQIQIIGILVVTFAVSAMNFEKMQGQAKAAKAAK